MWHEFWQAGILILSYKQSEQKSETNFFRHHPVLLEGETSAGKTSLIRHMARLTGNTVVRINNHEHTDLQEYIGSYAADADQRLVFVEGHFSIYSSSIR